MQKHLSDGELRAALDGELGTKQIHHIEMCTSCQARQQELKVKHLEAGRLLALLNPASRCFTFNSCCRV